MEPTQLRLPICGVLYYLGEAVRGQIIDAVVETMVAKLGCALGKHPQLGFDEMIDLGAERRISRGWRLGANATGEPNCQEQAEQCSHQTHTGWVIVSALYG